MLVVFYTCGHRGLLIEDCICCSYAFNELWTGIKLGNRNTLLLYCYQTMNGEPEGHFVNWMVNEDFVQHIMDCRNIGMETYNV